MINSAFVSFELFCLSILIYSCVFHAYAFLFENYLLFFSDADILVKDWTYHKTTHIYVFDLFQLILQVLGELIGALYWTPLAGQVVESIPGGGHGSGQ